MDGQRGRLRSVIFVALGCAMLSLLPKLWLHLTGAAPFNADEAVVGLMARHILAGARPAFFYGQAYMGSLDAFLVAGAFTLFGPTVVGIRIVQAALYAVAVALTVVLADRMHRDLRICAFAGLLMAIPSVNTTLYTSVSLGGYGEALVLGLLLILLALRLAEGTGGVVGFAVWGALAAFSFWVFALTLVFVIPAAAALGSGLRRSGPGRGAKIAGLAAGAALGLLPWVLGLRQVGLLPALLEIGGSAVSGASPQGWIESLGFHLANLSVLGATVILGLRPPWEVRWLALPLAPIVLALWLAAGLFAVRALARRDRARTGRLLLAAIVGVTLLAFVLLPFGADPSGRYFLPLAIPMAVLGAEALAALGRRSGALAWACLAIVALFHAWGLGQSIRRSPPGVTTQFDAITWIDRGYDVRLREFLLTHGERRGYSTYWVSYPLAFLSDEELIFVPALPYHADLRYAARDDRYPAYSRDVAASPRVAYITAHNAALDARLQAGLRDAGITWHETWIGDYHVFHDLSRPASPQDLGLLLRSTSGRPAGPAEPATDAAPAVAAGIP